MDPLSANIFTLFTSFLDVDSLRAISLVQKKWYFATDSHSIWKHLALNMFPHLEFTQDFAPYGGNTRKLVLDENRKNRSMVFQFEMENFLEKSHRIYSPFWTLGGFQFRLIIDPLGNSHVVQQIPGVSVYLECRPIIQDGSEDWKCPCKFKLTFQGTRKTFYWSTDSSCKNFNKEQKNWGTHQLISRDDLEKNLHYGLFIIRTQIQFVSLKAHIYMTRHFQHFRGIGLCDPENVIQMDILPEDNTEDILESLNLSDRSSRLWIMYKGIPHIVVNDDYSLFSQLYFYRDERDEIFIWLELDSECLIDPTPNPYINGNIESDDILVFLKRWNPVSEIMEFWTHWMIKKNNTELDFKSTISLYSGIPFPKIFLFQEPVGGNWEYSLTHPPVFPLPHGSVILLVEEDHIPGVMKFYDSARKIALQNYQKLLHLSQHKILDFQDLYCPLYYLGYHKERIRSILKNFDSVNEALRFIQEERHLAYCCDRCGISDFRGARYHCEECDDFDLCEQCFHQGLDQKHGYRLDRLIWVREENCGFHPASHKVTVFLPPSLT